MKRYKTTILIAAGIFVFDAFVLNQGAVAVFVVLLTLFVFLPCALWGSRTSRALYLERLTRAGIYLLAAVAVFAANVLQNRMADRRAIELGNACLAYHSKYQHYPQRLQELLPEFLPSVPLAKYTLGGGSFFHYAALSGKEPMLYYEALPPFGRRFYHWKPAGGATGSEPRPNLGDGPQLSHSPGIPASSSASSASQVIGPASKP